MVSTKPGVHHGEACIDGTRMSVAQIVGAFAGSDAAEGIASDYGITLAAVWEALEYAADMVTAASGMGPDQVRELCAGGAATDEA